MICFSNFFFYLFNSKKYGTTHLKNKTGHLGGMFVQGLALEHFSKPCAMKHLICKTLR